MSKKYPFKFLDSYTKEDTDIFFGREEETDILYDMVFQSNIVLVYGESGTGKSSLIQCGLSSKFQSHDWLPINIRRGNNLNDAMQKALELRMGNKEESSADELGWLDDIMEEEASQETNEESKWGTVFKSIYLNHFKPIYIIFDQFEELYILGDREEQHQFIQSVEEILSVNQPVTLLFSIREEYLGYLYDFEKAVPQLLRKKLRIEPMNLGKVQEVIVGASKYENSNVTLQQGQETDIAKGIFEQIKGGGKRLTIELPYLQVFLDKLYLSITEDDSRQADALISSQAVAELGNIDDILRDFLEEQVKKIHGKLLQQHDQPSETLWKVLSPFATLEGTKEPISKQDLYDRLDTALFAYAPSPQQAIEAIVEGFVNSRILRYSESNELYEISHDSLAQRIAEKRDDEEIALLEIRRLVKGQLSLKESARSLFSENQLEFMSPFLQKLTLSEEEQDFINRSRAKVEATQKEKERIRQRELDDAARIKKNLRFAVVAAIFAGLLAIGAGYFYLDASQKEKLAEKHAKEAESNAMQAKLEQQKAEAEKQKAQEALDEVLTEKIDRQMASMRTLISLGQSRLVQSNIEECLTLVSNISQPSIAVDILKKLENIAPSSNKEIIRKELRKLQ